MSVQEEEIDIQKNLSRILATVENAEKFVPKLRALVYGPSGVGKTVFTFQVLQKITPPEKSIVYIDFKTGIDVLSNPEWLPLRKRVVRIPFTNIKDVETISIAIYEKIPPFDNVGALVLDEASSMSAKDLDEVIKLNIKRDSSKNPDIAVWEDYGMEQRRFSRLVRGVLSIPNIHIVLLAHVRNDKVNGITAIDAAFQPGLVSIIKQDMSLVAYLNAKEIPSATDEPTYLRDAQVHPTRFVSAKTRISNLPVRVETTTLIEAIVAYTKGEIADVEPIQVEVEDTEVIVDVEGTDSSDVIVFNE